MLKFFKKSIFVFFILFSLFSLSYAEITDEQLLNNAKKMEEIITEGLKKLHIPGATLSISRVDKVIYTNAFGKTTIENNTPQNVTLHTLFPVSSVSKNVTAILVGALVDEGILSFDDKVRKYLPDIFICNEEFSKELTILDLISHRCGLKNFSGDTLFKANYDNDKILSIFKYLKQRPGEFRKIYAYQNIIYGIIGMVIEKATGEKYEDLVKKYIFDKMDMKYSSAIRIDAESSKFGYFKYLLSRFSYDREKIGFFKSVWNLIYLPLIHKTKDIVISHSRSMDEIIPLDAIGFFQKFPATAGISLSAEDFGKWLAMLANRGKYNGKQIVSEKTFEILTSNLAEITKLKDNDCTFVKSRYSRDGLYYGAGFFNGTYFDSGNNGRHILFHMGGIYGATAFFAVSLKDNISVGVICNLGGVAQTLFCEYMVNQFLDLSFGFSKIDWIQADINRKNYYSNKQHEFQKQLEERNPEPIEELDKYTGTYSSEIYGDINIFKEDNDLFITNGIKTAKMTHINGNNFSFLSKDLMHVFFDENEYIFFSKEDDKIDSCFISCFDENKTKFIKK